MKKRIINLLLLFAAVLSLSVLSACDGDTKEKQKSPYEADYDGYRFVIGWSNADSFNEVDYTEEEVGEDGVLQAALYRRNKAVEEKLNINITDRNTGGSDMALKAMSDAVLAGDQAEFEVYDGTVSILYQASLSGYCRDLNSISSFDSSHDWWDAGLVHDYSLGSPRLYYVSGDINVMDDFGASCLFFNKSLFFSNRMDYPYELVTNGEWTYEAFAALVKGLSRDLNSNGKWDLNDRYGFIADADELISVLGGFGTQVLKAEEGTVSLNDSDVAKNQVTKLLGELYRADSYDVVIAGEDLSIDSFKLFNQGQAFFTSGDVSDVITLRADSKNLFGILPYPKYDAEQTDYRSAVNNETATAVAILRCSADPVRSGNILEWLGSMSEEVVSAEGNYLPLCDEESQTMLGYITGSKLFQPIREGDAAYDAIVEMATDKEQDYASMLESNKTAIAGEYMDTTDYYSKNTDNEIKEVVDVISSDFNISFWNYNYANETTKEDVKAWAEAGISLAQSPHFNYERDSVEHMLELLDECQKYGMRVILCVEGLEYVYASEEATYRALFERVYEDFGSHPAIYAFAVGDEPSNATYFKNLETACKIVKEVAPDAKPFVNFLPYYTGIEDEVYGGKNFLNEMTKTVEACGLDFFSYDCYAQMHYNAGTESISGYFNSIRKYSELAKETGAEWWNTVLATGHWNYRAPDENDLRWQLTTSVASGAKGVIWYQWYDSLSLANYHGSPIDEFGEKSPTYYAMAHVLKLFHTQHGQLMSELNFKASYHFGQAYGGFSAFPEKVHANIIRMEATKNLPGIISFFTDDKGNEYVVIVNNSQTTTGYFTMVLKDTTENAILVRQNGNARVNCIGGNALAQRKVVGNEIHLSMYLNPGQMEIWQIS